MLEISTNIQFADTAPHPGFLPDLHELLADTHVNHRADTLDETMPRDPTVFHERHLPHYEFVDPRHVEVLARLFGELGDLSTEELTLVHHLAEKIKAKAAHIERHDFVAAGHTLAESEKFHAHARVLRESVHAFQTELRTRILTSLGHADPQHCEVSEFQHLTRAYVRHHAHAAFGTTAETLFTPAHVAHVRSRLASHAENVGGALTRHFDQYAAQYASVARVDHPTEMLTVRSATEVDDECFARLPDSIQSALPILASVFRGVPESFFFGSTAAAAQSPRAPTRVDDLDGEFPLDHLSTVKIKLDALVAAGSIYTDKEGTQPGYEQKTLRSYGESECLSGFVVSDVRDANGAPIFVPFEIFGVAPGCGVNQLGHVPKTLTNFERGGETISFLGIEGLQDQYVLNFLAEFDLNAINHFTTATVKAKDALRLDKLCRLGCTVISGIIATIEATCARYAGITEPKVRVLLDRAQPIIATLWDAHTRLQRESTTRKTEPLGATELAVAPVEIQTALTDFTVFCEQLHEHKLALGAAYEELLRAGSMDELLAIYARVADRQEFFDGLADKIRRAPAGRELHHLALDRFQLNFLRQFFERLTVQIEKYMRIGSVPQHLLARLKSMFSDTADIAAYRLTPDTVR